MEAQHAYITRRTYICIFKNHFEVISILRNRITEYSAIQIKEFLLNENSWIFIDNNVFSL